MFLTTSLSALFFVNFSFRKTDTFLCSNEKSLNIYFCTFTRVETNYYSLFAENFAQNDSDIQTHFFGICDLKTLKKWKPCPFGYSSKSCCPKEKSVYKRVCDIQYITSEPHCNCNGIMKSRQLENIPDFPTCFLGGRCLNSNCTLISRRQARKPVIHNWMQCMTKHPRTESEFPPSSSRVKRSETPTIIGRFGEINHIGLLHNRHYPRTGCWSSSCEYQSYVPADVKNKRLYTLKLDDNNINLERRSNAALRRILRTISSKNYKRALDGDEKTEEMVDDDDEEDDNMGEDIAIQEDEEEEQLLTTTEELEKSELSKEQRQEALKSKNITDNDTITDDTKSGREKLILCQFLLVVLTTCIIFHHNIKYTI